MALLLTSCPGDIWDDSMEENRDTKYMPVLMERSQLESSVAVLEKQDLKKPGKMYFYGRYIFIIEKYKGIHMIDNEDATNPKNLLFIRVPGCVDVAAKQNYLYVDNATDLVTIDISALPELSVTKRVSNVFPDLLPPDANLMPEQFNRDNRPENTVIVEWIENNK